MTQLANLGKLQTVAWQQVQEKADCLEAAYAHVGSQGFPIDLNLLLPPPDDPLRLTLLLELIKTDLEIRWRKGGRLIPARLEDYLEKFPELGPTSQLTAE